MLLIIFKGNTSQRCEGCSSWQEQHQCGWNDSSITHYSVQTGLYALPFQVCSGKPAPLRAAPWAHVVLMSLLDYWQNARLSIPNFFSKCSQNFSYFCFHLQCLVWNRLLSLSFLWKSCVTLNPGIGLNFRNVLKKARFCIWWLSSVTSISPNAHCASMKCLGERPSAELLMCWKTDIFVFVWSPLKPFLKRFNVSYI